MEPIIESPLDTDLYKFTMQQYFWAKCRGMQAEYRFQARNAAQVGFDYCEVAGLIREQVAAMADLRFTEDRIATLRGLGHFGEEYLQWLQGYRFNPAQVRISTEGGQFGLRVAGPLEEATLWEVPLLAITQEVVYQNSATVRVHAMMRLLTHITEVKRAMMGQAVDGAQTPFQFMEFGTRRRLSRAHQWDVLGTLQAVMGGALKGTSNVQAAADFGLPCYGTQAHEYYQVAQVTAPSLREFVQYALDEWLLFYRGKLAVALTDIIPSAAWLQQMDALHAKLLTGFRQDSGDPNEWSNLLRDRLQALGVAPRTKDAVYSDGLTLRGGYDLYRTWAPRFRSVLPGIGTSLTHNAGPGCPALQNVLKLVRLDGMPVAKLSDDPGKGMCEDPEYVALLGRTFELGGY